MTVVSWEAIWSALSLYNAQLTTILGSSAGRAYMIGDLQAFKELGGTVDAIKVRAASAEYARTYTELLRSEGATVINGEKVPWLKDSTQAQRDDISQIIEDGIREGKYPGVKEKVGGGYPEGTVAHDLEQYFEGQRSKASMVARTEMGRIVNDGKLDRFQGEGEEYVEVYDNEGPHSCDACGTANGQVWSIEDARNNAKEHPNCVRNFGYVRRSKAVSAAVAPRHIDMSIFDWFSRKCVAAVTA
jgi:SPP1 gp7 family putative phage head morphogenesis protein